MLRGASTDARAALLKQLNRLGQQKVAQGWTFDPVYTAAMDRDLRVLASLRRPADLAQRSGSGHATSAPPARSARAFSPQERAQVLATLDQKRF